MSSPLASSGTMALLLKKCGEALPEACSLLFLGFLLADNLQDVFWKQHPQQYLTV